VFAQPRFSRAGVNLSTGCQTRPCKRPINAGDTALSSQSNAGCAAPAVLSQCHPTHALEKQKNQSFCELPGCTKSQAGSRTQNRPRSRSTNPRGRSIGIAPQRSRQKAEAASAHTHSLHVGVPGEHRYPLSSRKLLTPAHSLLSSWPILLCRSIQLMWDWLNLILSWTRDCLATARTTRTPSGVDLLPLDGAPSTRLSPRTCPKYRRSRQDISGHVA